MFLAVLARVTAVEMTDQNRLDLAAAITARRGQKFGTAKAAYVAAEVNAGTWSRAEAGHPVRADILRKIIRTLWPQSDGDWSLIVGGDPDHPDYVSAPGDRDPHAASDADLLAAIREVREEVRALRERVERGS